MPAADGGVKPLPACARTAEGETSIGFYDCPSMTFVRPELKTDRCLAWQELGRGGTKAAALNDVRRASPHAWLNDAAVRRASLMHGALLHAGAVCMHLFRVPHHHWPLPDIPYTGQPQQRGPCQGWVCPCSQQRAGLQACMGITNRVSIGWGGRDTGGQPLLVPQDRAGGADCCLSGPRTM